MSEVESAAAGAFRRWWQMRPQGSLTDYCLVAWPAAQTRKLWIAVLVAPLIETLVLGGVLRLLEFATRRRQILALLSALLWGGAHAWFHPLWFFGTVWSFYVFSRGWLAWRPVSYKHAFAAAAVPHALVNSSALLMQFLARS
jgi:hypothetical protein